MNKDQSQQWTEEIKSKHYLLDLQLGEVWRYRDLIYMFVKRDFITFYKQTILGPLWFVIQPLLATIMFYLIFVVLAKTQGQGLQAMLFILSGQVIWSYFSDTLNKVSTVFTANATILGKVYFPRLVMPLSITLSGLIRFFIQFLLFLSILIYALLSGDNHIQPNWWILCFPFLVLLMGMLALGLGMIFSSLTTKYKDLTFLLTFGISLYMYVTPVVLPLSMFGKYKFLVELNPLTGIFECFRYGFMGTGDFDLKMLLYSTITIFFILAIGAIIFNKVQKSFMDTV